MQHHVWLDSSDRCVHRFAIKQVGGDRGRTRGFLAIAQTDDLVSGSLKFTGHILAREPIATGQQRAWPAHLRTTPHARCA